MKKILTVLMSVVMLAGFTSCNKSSEEKSNAENEKISVAVDKTISALEQAQTADDVRVIRFAFDDEFDKIATEALGFDPNQELSKLTDEQCDAADAFYKEHKAEREKVKEAVNNAYNRLGGE